MVDWAYHTMCACVPRLQWTPNVSASDSRIHVAPAQVRHVQVTWVSKMAKYWDHCCAYGKVSLVRTWGQGWGDFLCSLFSFTLSISAAQNKRCETMTSCLSETMGMWCVVI